MVMELETVCASPLGSPDTQSSACTATGVCAGRDSGNLGARAARRVEYQGGALMHSRGGLLTAGVFPFLALYHAFLDGAVGESKAVEVGERHRSVGSNLTAQGNRQALGRTAREVLDADINRNRCGFQNLRRRGQPDGGLHKRHAEFLDAEAAAGHLGGFIAAALIIGRRRRGSGLVMPDQADVIFAELPWRLWGYPRCFRRVLLSLH